MKLDIFKKIILKLNGSNMLNFLSDTAFIKLVYYARMNKKIDLKNPATFNEKLNWLKIYNRDPLYTLLVDKYEVKKYIANKIGDEYIIPTLGVWNTFDEIDFDSLPNQFVLKCTHDSGGLISCTNKEKLDKETIKTQINKSLKNNFYC